jgi:NAD(P)-dependent dehydrogenase (short-subunit alcohol dehydrogenase family)
LNQKLMPESVPRGKTPEIMQKDLIETFRVNAIGPIHLFNAFMPLLKKGSAKKAIAISTGMADAELVSKFELDISPSYAISKAALNMAVAKFDAQYRKEGILFLAISPGFVDTGKSATRKYTRSPRRTRPFYSRELPKSPRNNSRA